MTTIPQLALRTATDEDWPAIAEVDELAFGEGPMPEPVRVAARARLELDRAVLAEDPSAPADGRLVGLTTAYTLTMTVPGGPLPVAGVTWVGVRPTHRRRGVLRSLMTRQLHDLHDQGREPIAVLWAAEPAIYGRFGYGMASCHLALTIPRGPTVLADTPVDAALRLRYVTPEASVALTQSVYDAVAARRPGMPARTSVWAEQSVLDPEANRRGASPLRVVVAEDGDGVRGYARFATKGEWVDGVPAGEVRVREALAVDAAAYATVWRFLCDQDLMKTVTVPSLAIDDPLLHLLRDPRAARPVLTDGLHVRLVDLDRALCARGYASELDVVLDVRDPLCPWNDGRWRLRTGEEGVTCTPSDDAADLVLGVTELGAAYLGGTTLAALARAGRVQEARAGALRATSLAFASEVAPWCPVEF